MSILEALENGDLEKIMECLGNNHFTLNPDESENSFLHLATEYENESSRSIMKAILQHWQENQLDIDQPNIDGHTPLHCAIINENPEAVQMLLEAGASLTATDNRGDTALHHAAQTDPSSSSTAIIILNLLIQEAHKQNISVDIENEMLPPPAYSPDDKNLDNYPTHYAITSHFLEGVKMLLEAGADPEARSNEDQILDLSFENGTPEITRAIIKAGATISHSTDDEDSVLALALKGEYYEHAAVLIECGVDLFEPFYTDETDDEKGGKILPLQWLANHAPTEKDDPNFQTLLRTLILFYPEHYPKIQSNHDFNTLIKVLTTTIIAEFSTLIEVYINTSDTYPNDPAFHIVKRLPVELRLYILQFKAPQIITTHLEENNQQNIDSTTEISNSLLRESDALFIASPKNPNINSAKIILFSAIQAYLALSTEAEELPMLTNIQRDELQCLLTLLIQNIGIRICTTTARASLGLQLQNFLCNDLKSETLENNPENALPLAFLQNIKDWCDDITASNTTTPSMALPH